MRTLLALACAALLASPAGAATASAEVGPPRFLDPAAGIGTAIAINNFGDVAGWHVAADGDNYHAFVWTGHAGFADIATLGGAASEAFDINDLGQVIGWATTADGTMHGFVWTRSAGMKDLGPYAVFAPRAINNLGVIAGALNGQAALRMPDGSYRPLGTLGGSFSIALDVNDRGEAVGASTFDSGPTHETHPFYWSAKTGMIDIHEPGTPGGAATRIDNGSEAAGYLVPGVEFQSRVYTWTRKGGAVDIGGYPGGFIDGTDYGNVYGINGLGQVVATSTFPGDEITRQLLWTGGAGPFVVAEDGIPDSSHMGINDAGEVAGSTHAPGGHMTPVVWTTALTSGEQADSLRALVEDLSLRGALRRQDAKVLTKKAGNSTKFAKQVAVLVRSHRLSASDASMLTRAIR